MELKLFNNYDHPNMTYVVDVVDVTVVFIWNRRNKHHKCYNWLGLNNLYLDLLKTPGKKSSLMMVYIVRKQNITLNKPRFRLENRVRCSSDALALRNEIKVTAEGIGKPQTSKLFHWRVHLFGETNQAETTLFPLENPIEKWHDCIHNFVTKLGICSTSKVTPKPTALTIRTNGAVPPRQGVVLAGNGLVLKALAGDCLLACLHTHLHEGNQRLVLKTSWSSQQTWFQAQRTLFVLSGFFFGTWPKKITSKKKSLAGTIRSAMISFAASRCY